VTEVLYPRRRRAELMMAMVAAGILGLLARPGLVRAQTHDAQPAVIEVSGNGEVQAPPDLAVVRVTIQTHGPTAMAAAGANAKLANQVMAALKSKLNGRGTVQTGAFQLYPEYSRPTAEGAKVVGYQVANALTVRTAALELAGPLVDTALAAGANRIDSLSFELKNDTGARREALTRAVAAARARAEAIAQALGVKLGRVLRASTAMQPLRMPMPRMALAMAPGEQTPIEPGEVTVSATVKIVYAISG